MFYENDADRFPVRKNPRLQSFDYTSCNYYFVTVCTRDKRCLFGEPEKHSALGEVAAACLKEIPDHFSGVRVDKWVVMPNHIHAILVLDGSGASLPTIVGQYKSTVTRRSHTIVPDLMIWQSSFHDHVIRSQADYERIWGYIDQNPARWMTVFI